METFLFIMAGLCLIGGLLGSVLPALPGLPLSYIGLLLLQLTDHAQFSTAFMLVWLGVVLVITVLDNFIPIWSTRQAGGSKAGVWGSTIGLVVGLLLPPVGILVGAILGELLVGSDVRTSLKAGIGALVGFLVGTVMKVAVGVVFIYYYVVEIVKLFH